MSDPEIKWRHFIEPVPKFLKQQPHQGGDSNVAFFKYVESNLSGTEKSTKKKYSFIMSKTSITLLVGLLLLLSLLFFMAGFFISKDIYKDHKKPSYEDARHKEETFGHEFSKNHPKVMEGAKALENATEGIITSSTSSLSPKESKAGSPQMSHEAPSEKGQGVGNTVVSKAQDYYHRLVGVGEAKKSETADSPLKRHPASAQVKTVHQAEQARLWPKTPGSDEMFEVKPASDISHAPPHVKAITTYNYDVDNYLPDQVGSKSEKEVAPQWSVTPEVSEYESQFLDNPATPTFTSDQINEMAHVNKYMVQVGAFQKIENAQQLVGRLARNGVDSNIYQGWDDNQRPWYFVRMGNHLTIHKANQHALNIVEQGNLYGKENPTPYAIVVKGTSTEKLVG